MRSTSTLLLVNIAQLLTLRSDGEGPRRGASLSELGIIENAAVLCLGGKIVSVGRTKDALRDPWVKKNRKEDCRSRLPRSRRAARLCRFAHSPRFHAPAVS